MPPTRIIGTTPPILEPGPLAHRCRYGLGVWMGLVPRFHPQAQVAHMCRYVSGVAGGYSVILLVLEEGTDVLAGSNDACDRGAD